MSDNNEKAIAEFIGVKVQYDDYGQYIWGVEKNGGLQMIADLRGWGAIQKLFTDKDGRLSEENHKKAAKFQDDLGQFIVDAINEKLKSVV